MAALTLATIIAAVGVAASVASVGISMSNMGEQKKQTELLKKNEATRQNQMNLDAMRKKRDIIRNAQMAQAQSASAAGAQGAAESSGAAGAQGAISGQAGVNMLGVSQNQELGNRMFDTNKQLADSYGASSQTASLAGGLSSLGGLMTKNNATIAKVGSYIGG